MPQQRSNTPLWITVLICSALTAGVFLYPHKPEQSSDIPRSASALTFSHDVAPIVFARCAGCHHPGEAAPFSLLTYDDVRRRSRQIVEVTQKRFMPPWLPAQGHGDLTGVRRLSDAELQTIRNWVDAGAPPGDPSQMPPTPVFTSGWQTGTPDLVLESPAYTLSSQERDVFRNFVVPVPIDSPKWVESIELRPENPKVTHHARLGVDSSNESVRRDAEDPGPGYAGMAWAQDPDGQLVIWAPGMIATPGTPGVAWRLYPKTALVLHTHMQPSGKSEIVKFKIGIHFAKNAPQQHPAMLRIGSCDIDIPAGAKHHVVTDSYTLPIDVDVYTIFPHAHSLCTELRVAAKRSDGSEERLISIEHFDENWHDSYRYRQPIRLPKGTRLISTFAYDNTRDNPRNRNRPPKRTVYGSNANDEMADVYLQMTAVKPDQRAVLMENYQHYEAQAQIAGYKKSLEVYENNPSSLEGLATAYVALGEPRNAIPILQQRMKTGPTEVFPLVSLGMALLVGGDFAQAEAKQHEALAMDAEYPLAWFGLGKALEGQKKLEAAEDAYRRALELSPGSIEAHLCLADLLMRRGELDKAKKTCTAALNDSPDMANIYVKLAEICAKQKDYDQCLTYCKMAQRFAPYTHPPKVLLAVYCCANGESERGLKLLQEARTESPQHPMSALILGQLARRSNDLKGARDYFAAAAALPIPENWPESHRKRFLVLLHSERLQLAEQLQDVGMARDALWHWMKCDPENPQLRKMLDALPGGAAPQL